jgi:hypothetical protein
MFFLIKFPFKLVWNSTVVNNFHLFFIISQIHNIQVFRFRFFQTKCKYL